MDGYVDSILDFTSMTRSSYPLLPNNCFYDAVFLCVCLCIVWRKKKKKK